MTNLPLNRDSYKCDVLVIGAGPAGASLAFFLGSSGIDVILADRKSKIEEPARCAGYVPANLARFFDFRLKGLKNSISEMETYISHCRKETAITCSGPGRSFVKMSVLKAPGYLIDRREMISDWVERFKKNGGAYIPRTRVTSICKGNVYAFCGNKKIKIIPRIIAGADGPVSVAGKSIGSQNIRFLAGLNCRLENVSAYEKSTKVVFSPEIKGGYAWIFPGGNYLNVGLGADLSLYVPGKGRTGVIRNMFEWLIAQLKNTALFNDIIFNTDSIQNVKKTVVSGLIPVSGMVGKPTKGNVLLTGDAAGLCNPVTGAGIFNAVYSSKIASGYILKALAKNDLGILKSLKEGYEDYFGMSLNRALVKRQVTYNNWNSCNGGYEFERLIRHVWVAFKEYKNKMF